MSSCQSGTKQHTRLKQWTPCRYSKLHLSPVVASHIRGNCGHFVFCEPESPTVVFTSTHAHLCCCLLAYANESCSITHREIAVFPHHPFLMSVLTLIQRFKSPNLFQSPSESKNSFVKFPPTTAKDDATVRHNAKLDGVLPAIAGDVIYFVFLFDSFKG
jgi:hypothetical protein